MQLRIYLGSEAAGLPLSIELDLTLASGVKLDQRQARPASSSITVARDHRRAA
jgi:hypothetical protein